MMMPKIRFDLHPPAQLNHKLKLICKRILLSLHPVLLIHLLRMEIVRLISFQRPIQEWNFHLYFYNKLLLRSHLKPLLIRTMLISFLTKFQFLNQLFRWFLPI
ncbi:hypothetical protein BLA29_013734, partial [Euroglyphus maynei]